MYYVLAFLVGVVVGAACLLVVVWEWQKNLKRRAAESDAQVRRANETLTAAKVKETEVFLAVKMKEDDVNRRARELHNQQQEFQRQAISYKEFQEENRTLKRDLQNVDVHLNKLQLDGQAQQQRQKVLDERSTQLAKRYLAETVKAVVAAVGPSNFSACKQRLVDAIERVRAIGFEVSSTEEAKLLTDLRGEFEKEVRAQFQREEQARIKAQIRDEERLKREIDRELKQLERERAAVQAALDQALAEAKGQHTAEVERLQTRLAEAEEKSKRAISMAQQTKAGYVYIISNIGTFGDGVFKVGMTRRLEPKERVDELGSASVPFPFDIHMMISCDDAPALENALHRALHKNRINKVNPRKEFFKSTINQLAQIVEANRGKVDFVAEPEALQYRQSQTISDDDAAYIERVYDEAEDNENSTPSEP